MEEMRRAVTVAILLWPLSGCGQGPPTLAGGQPVGHWVEALQSPDSQLRKTAVFKLGNVGSTDEAVLHSLLGALKDPDAAVRREAILALMKYGPGAREAVPLLTELQQNDQDARVRSYAAKALRKFESTDLERSATQ
jgi:HEAT repeat protein